MARNKNRDWQVGDYVTIYSHARRRHGVISISERIWGELYYGVHVFAYFSPYLFDKKWQQHDPYYIVGVKHRYILSKLRKHTAVKYKLMGLGI